MISISLCMIVKNEESVLARCLSSVGGLVDEIIIVDTGSDDATKKVAAEFTDKIYDYEWADDFSAARNFAFSKATKDYQMWLDADDVITEDARKKIFELKAGLDNSVDIVMMKYHTHFDRNGIPILTSTRERIFKREKDYKWNDPVHEYVQLTGKIHYADDIFITHKKNAKPNSSNRNIKIYENLIAADKKLSPRSTYYYARELMDHRRYSDAAEYFNKFLDEGKGWVEDNIASCYNLGICYRQMEDKGRSVDAFLRSFRYDLPRAESCCEIGYHFKKCSDYKKAVYWFKLAAEMTLPPTIGFVLNDYWGYIPNIELAVCYSLMGKIEEAVYHNQEAKKYKPQSTAVAHNEKYFSNIISYTGKASSPQASISGSS